ncbi:MAG: hypothetical protein K6F84_02965 [Lachnospiraceae bacterium]|nr:hypothetical protein [Lachnospiraceae bacterium]
MKSVYNICKIRTGLSFKSPVWIVSAVSVFTFVGIMYLVTPVYVCSSFLLSSMFMFFLGIYIAMSIHDRENDVFEEALLLHCDKERVYLISREIITLVMCILFSSFLTFYPVVRALLKPSFFMRSLTAYDVICGGLFIFLCGLCGLQTGDFVHPRFINKKPGVAALLMFLALTVCKYGLVSKASVFRILDIITPPVLDSFKLLGDKDVFVKGVGFIMIRLLIYAVVVMIVKIIFLKKHRYRY